MLVAVIVSLLTGFTIVVSRTLNAGLAAETSIVRSTLYNYVFGLATSLCLLVALGWNFTLDFSSFELSQLWLYTGGMLGVVVVTLSNSLVLKISAFYMTLLLFIGQVFTGILLDAILTQSFQWQNLLGGALVTIGFLINLKADSAS